MITKEHYEQAKITVAEYERQQENLRTNPYFTLPIAEIVLKYYYDSETEPKIALCNRIKNSLETKGITNAIELIDFVASAKKCLPVRKRIQCSFRNLGDVTMELLIRSIRNIGFDIETEIP